MMAIDFLTYFQKFEDDVSEVVAAAEKWYQEKSYYQVKKPDSNRMVILDSVELDNVDLSTKLAEFAAWCAYYNTKTVKWSAIYQYLDSLFERLVNEFIAKNPKNYPLQKAKAKSKYAMIERAAQIARNKYKKSEAALNQSEKQHGLISRLITYKQMESDSKGHRRFYD